MMGRKKSIKHKFKIIMIVLLISSAMLFIVDYLRVIYTIDTTLSTKFSDVMSTYDIDAVSRYFESDTIFEYQNDECLYTDTYVNLKNNVSESFKEDKVRYYKSSSYGGFDNNSIFFDKKELYVTCFIPNKFKGSEVGFYIEIRRVGYSKYKISKCYSDDPVFGYIFFGIEPKDKTGTV